VKRLVRCTVLTAGACASTLLVLGGGAGSEDLQAVGQQPVQHPLAGAAACWLSLANIRVPGQQPVPHVLGTSGCCKLTEARGPCGSGPHGTWQPVFIEAGAAAGWGWE
jgi:hypothetical protein